MNHINESYVLNEWAVPGIVARVKYFTGDVFSLPFTDPNFAKTTFLGLYNKKWVSKIWAYM